jgi:signal transduction histidine kinase
MRKRADGDDRAKQELSRPERALWDQTRILQSILSSIGEGVVVADEHGKLLFFNPVAEQILGLSLIDSGTDQWSDIYGLFLSDKATPYPAHELPLARAIRGENTDAVEIFVRNPKIPEGRCVNVTGRPIRDEEGIVKGGVVVFHDITKRKKAEEEINRLYGEVRELNAILEEKVKQRTKELEAAVKAAEVANRAKSDFLASMSHELRTPLNAIIGFAQVLQEQYFGELNERQTGYIKDILESGRHLLALINDVLDLSRIEAGKVELELSVVNISDLLEHSLIMVKEKALKQGISLELKASEVLRGL